MDQEKIKKEIKRIHAKILRSNYFQPWGLSLLNKEIKLVELEEMPSPAFTTGDFIYLNLSNEMFQKYDMETLLTLFLLHEISHIMFYHKYRCKNRDPQIWNIAGDMVINLILRDIQNEANDNTQNQIKAHINEINSKDITMDSQFEHMTEEQIYDYLQKNNVTKTTKKMKLSKLLNSSDIQDQQESSDEGNDGGQNSDSEGNNEDQNSNGEGNNEDQNSNGEGNNEDQNSNILDSDVTVTTTEIKLNNGTIKNIHVDVPNNIEKKLGDEKQEQKQVKLSRNLLGSRMKGCGSSPGLNLLKKMMKVKINWDKVLRDAIKSKLEPSNEISWGKPRRVWMANPRLPYMPNFEDEEHYGMGIVSVDESGSMSDSDVQKAVDIIRQFNKYFSKILILKHDSEIVWETEVEDFDMINIKDLLMRRSSGGTSHKDVIRKIIDISKTEEISIYIGISDLMSDIEQHQHKITTIPTVWITPNESFSNKITGKIIKIES